MRPGCDPGCNLGRPAVEAAHAALERVDESRYRSVCPACEFGILLMRREDDGIGPARPAGRRLLRQDHCVTCGQSVVYVDEEVNGEPLYDEAVLEVHGS